MNNCGKLKDWSPGATYHITSRGTRKDFLFLDSMDRYRFLFILETSKTQYKFKLHAYSLMSNHLHLLIETSNYPPNLIMKTIHQSYARYFNRKYNLSGHVFQGRYAAQFINNSAYFLAVSKYIHRNAVEAHLVSKPQEYVWSSCAVYTTPTKNLQTLIDLKRTLSYFPKDPYEQYRIFVEIKKD